VQKADRAGLQCALHAIGDGAVKLAIDTLSHFGTPGHRHRIEHLELTSPGDGARLAAAGITASVQPAHADPVLLKAWPELLGEERYKRAFAYREFVDAGANLAIGSDAPTAPYKTLQNMYIATTRRSLREVESTATANAHFALSLSEAVSSASYGSAFSCFAEGRTGSLAEGKQANFVVAKMEWTPESLLRASVCETWFHGRKVYSVV
jgi:predicted amidohydrolase YtcJ